MASQFGVCGSLVMTNKPRDIDGMYRVDTFLHRYVNPPINLEGKTTEIVAWGLTQMFKLRGLVPQECLVIEMPNRVPNAMTLFHADSGIENFGDWVTAREHGEDGVFKILFCKEDGRVATALTCNVHDLNSYDGNTTFGDDFLIQASSAARYLRFGQVNHQIGPLARYLAGEDMVCPIQGAGEVMAKAIRLPHKKVGIHLT